MLCLLLSLLVGQCLCLDHSCSRDTEYPHTHPGARLQLHHPDFFIRCIQHCLVTAQTLLVPSDFCCAHSKSSLQRGEEHCSPPDGHPSPACPAEMPPAAQTPLACMWGTAAEGSKELNSVTAVTAAEVLPLLSTPEYDSPSSGLWGEDAFALPAGSPLCQRTVCHSELPTSRGTGNHWTESNGGSQSFPHTRRS